MMKKMLSALCLALCALLLALPVLAEGNGAVPVLTQQGDQLAVVFMPSDLAAGETFVYQLFDENGTVLETAMGQSNVWVPQYTGEGTYMVRAMYRNTAGETMTVDSALTSIGAVASEPVVSEPESVLLPMDEDAGAEDEGDVFDDFFGVEDEDEEPVSGYDALPWLEVQGTSVVTYNRGDTFLTGPGAEYYFTGNKTHGLKSGVTANIYGKSNGFLLIGFNRNANNPNLIKYGYLPILRAYKGTSYPELELAYVPISLKTADNFTDEPNVLAYGRGAYKITGKTFYSDTIVALAKVKGLGGIWIYIELEGYDDKTLEPVMIRGFVPMADVEFQ